MEKRYLETFSEMDADVKIFVDSEDSVNLAPLLLKQQEWYAIF